MKLIFNLANPASPEIVAAARDFAAVERLHPRFQVYLSSFLQWLGPASSIAEIRARHIEFATLISTDYRPFARVAEKLFAALQGDPANELPEERITTVPAKSEKREPLEIAIVSLPARQTEVSPHRNSDGEIVMTRAVEMDVAEAERRAQAAAASLAEFFGL
jgi:hypothetical protein